MTSSSLAGPVGASLLALCAVLGLIWLAQRAARLRGFARAPGAGRSLSVAEQLPLDAKRRLVLVVCEGRRALLVTGGPADLLIGWLPSQTGSDA